MASTFSQLDQRVTVLTHKSAGSMSESDRYALANMALDKLGQDVDLYETKRRSVLSPALFSDVFTYAIPSDLKGDSIIDIRAVGERLAVYEKKTNVPFDNEVRRGSSYPDFTIEVNEGTRYLRVNSANTPKYVTIHNCASISDNGTWAADTVSSDAANIATDGDNGIGDNDAVRFDILVGQSGNNNAVVSNSTMDAVDLTDYQNVSSIFLDLYIPSGLTLTSVAIRLGSDASNYYSGSATTSADGSSFSAGANTIRFDWTGFSTTGSPSITAIDYVQVTLSYGAAQTTVYGVRLDNIVARIGNLHELVYYSEHIATNSSGTRQRSFSDASDLTVLGSEGENMLIWLWAYFIAMSRREWTAAQSYLNEYDKAKTQYAMRYPSERPYLGFEYEQFGRDPNAGSDYVRFF